MPTNVTTKVRRQDAHHQAAPGTLSERSAGERSSSPQYGQWYGTTRELI
jgi:hypothetical protein